MIEINEVDNLKLRSKLILFITFSVWVSVFGKMCICNSFQHPHFWSARSRSNTPFYFLRNFLLFPFGLLCNLTLIIRIIIVHLNWKTRKSNLRLVVLRYWLNELSIPAISNGMNSRAYDTIYSSLGRMSPRYLHMCTSHRKMKSTTTFSSFGW